MATTNPAYQVKGTITGPEGRGVSGADVNLWWQRIRERSPLAEGKTAEDGTYLIRYNVPIDAPQRVLVVVQARGGGLELPLESPETPVAPVLTINLAATPADSSDYGTLLRSVTPLLQGLSLQDVVENDQHHDVTFLSDSISGRDKEQIMRLVVASRAERRLEVPAPAVYAFLVARVPTSLPASLLDASQNFAAIDSLVQHVGGADRLA